MPTLAPTPPLNGRLLHYQFPSSSKFFFAFFLSLNFYLIACCSPRQDILGQYSMVNLELFNIVDEVKKVSKAFLVHPRNVNADNATSTFSFPFNTHALHR